MRCHVCNVDVGEGQRFCHECGESLAGVTDATQELSMVEDLPSERDVSLPPNARTGEDALADTQAIDEVVDQPDTEALPAVGSPLEEPVVDAGPGRIGSSLFDPETAPPVAEPEWSDPIPPLSDDIFATTVNTPVDTAPDFESTTAIATHPVDESGSEPITGRQPVLFDVDAAHGSEPLLDGELRPFKIRPTLVLGFLGMLATLMVSVADIIDIQTDRPVDGIPRQILTVSDLGTNLAIGGFVGAALMLTGGMLHCFGLRWGAGLAGGSGLALVGWVALTLGLAEVPVDEAERITRNPLTPGPFTLTVTRDVGYWLIVAIAAIGILVFAFSLVSAGTGGRRGLNPWTAAIGAVGALVVAGGPLITVGGANFDVNFGTDTLPVAFFAGRLVQLGLIAVVGVVGFLVVRAYGLGLVGGAISVPFWLWLSSLLEITNRPLGVAAGNLGLSDTSPHAVTTVGVAVTFVMLVVAATIAIVQRPAVTA